MPLPKPKAEEKRSDFISRCMSDPRTIAEFPGEDQRSAVCVRQFGGPKQPATNEREALSKVGEDRIRVNISTKVNSEMIRREQRDGRDVIVVKSATLPDDVVMNGILYPAEEIEKSFKGLEGTPAPLGHPTVNNMFVPASSPLGLNVGYFGGWNANVQRRDGKVYLEKVIDVERANESKMGRRVLAALEQGRPIHTSTGLTMNLRECSRSDLADFEGFNMEFDHDAILLDEEGAATPEQGVGMLVNAATDAKGLKLSVVNSSLDNRMEEHIDMLGMELLSVMERKEAASKWAQMKSAIMEAIGFRRDMDEQPTQRKEAMTMAGEKEDGFEAMNKRLEAIEKSVATMSETVEAMSKTTEANSKAVAQWQANQDAEKTALVTEVVNAKVLTEEQAKATPIEALKALAANAKKPEDEAGQAAPGLFGGFGNANKGEHSLAEDWEK